MANTGTVVGAVIGVAVIGGAAYFFLKSQGVIKSQGGKLSISVSPSTVSQGQYPTVTVTGGTPNGSLYITMQTEPIFQHAVEYETVNFDSNGNFTGAFNYVSGTSSGVQVIIAEDATTGNIACATLTIS